MSLKLSIALRLLGISLFALGTWLIWWLAPDVWRPSGLALAAFLLMVLCISASLLNRDGRVPWLGSALSALFLAVLLVQAWTGTRWMGLARTILISVLAVTSGLCAIATVVVAVAG